MKTHSLILVAGLLMLVGFTIAWKIYRPKPTPPEPPAPAVRQKDGSLELERAASGLSSQAPAGSSPLKPRQEIPKGAKVERIVEVTVDPTPISGSNGSNSIGPSLKTASLSRPDALGATKCGPVTVDLSLVRMPDKSQRVLASSPDGQVVGGIDVPVNEPKVPKVLRWTAAGLAGYDTHVGRNVFGGQISYAKGPFVVSGGIIGGTGFVGAGVKF